MELMASVVTTSWRSSSTSERAVKRVGLEALRVSHQAAAARGASKYNGYGVDSIRSIVLYGRGRDTPPPPQQQPRADMCEV